MSEYTVETQRKMMYDCSKTKEGKVLLEYIEDLAVRKLRGTAEDIQLQAGMFNLWLDIKSEIEAGRNNG